MLKQDAPHNATNFNMAPLLAMCIDLDEPCMEPSVTPSSRVPWQMRTHFALFAACERALSGLRTVIFESDHIAYWTSYWIWSSSLLDQIR